MIAYIGPSYGGAIRLKKSIGKNITKSYRKLTCISSTGRKLSAGNGGLYAGIQRRKKIGLPGTCFRGAW
jgi:hypothetical protein